MDEAFIVVSIISGVFGILGLELLTHNWFRKERFKIEAYNLKKQNDLQLKKMAKELGLDTKSSTPQNNLTNAAGPLGNIGGLLDLAKNLKPGQLEEIIDIVAGRGGGEEEGPEESGGISGAIGDFLATEQGQQIAQSFLKGVTSGTQKTTDTGSQV